jgi:hypothetical protein
MLGRSESIGKCVRRESRPNLLSGAAPAVRSRSRGTGPSLFDVIGRAVAGAADFQYAAALVRPPARGYQVWTAPECTSEFARTRCVPHRNGVRLPADPAERPDVIAARDGRAEE